MDNSYLWYSALIKPPWAPPSWLFGSVWTDLYIITVIFPYFRLVMYANIPYLIWVLFATVLQFTITYLNK